MASICWNKDGTHGHFASLSAPAPRSGQPFDERDGQRVRFLTVIDPCRGARDVDGDEHAEGAGIKNLRLLSEPRRETLDRRQVLGNSSGRARRGGRGRSIWSPWKSVGNRTSRDRVEDQEQSPNVVGVSPVEVRYVNRPSQIVDARR